MSGGWLPKRIVFGNLEAIVRRGQGGKEWVNRVHSNVWAFGIAEDRNVTALEAGVWVETVTEDGRSFTV